MKRRNRKLRKALLMTCCALALVAISVGATLAYLTDTEAVTNVFTVGKVDISLDEAKVNPDGKENPSGERVRNNEYHLIPGRTYKKDPTVHVMGDSEDSWIFVKVENGLADIEAPADYQTEKSKNIEYQMTAGYGWIKLDGVDNVYYQAHTKQENDKKYLVFDHFTLMGDGLLNGVNPDPSANPDGDTAPKYIEDYKDAKIVVTAYAIQMAGFENDPAGAWKAGNWN